MKPLNAIRMSGREVLPLIEGGKGVSVSTGESSGAWAAAGGIGTFSAVNANTYDDNGDLVPLIYRGKTRRERNAELVEYSIKGGIDQTKIAYDKASGQGRLHMNVLWEMAAVEEILHGVLGQVSELVDGITCGAGMPYKLSQIAAQYKCYYYPIVSSARAFNALWKRSYNKSPEWLGGVVYEDPWRAGGHNGLSNVEDPNVPQDPFPRVMEIRKLMNQLGLNDVPIIMAGGVWYLREWSDWIDNPDLGPIAFQFGTRPLLTQESPISDQWKKKLLTLKKGDIYLNRFSPTGFYSSAVENDFLIELKGRNARQVAYSIEPLGDHSEPFPVGARGRLVYLTPHDKKMAESWKAQGFTQSMRTPDSTLIFVAPEIEDVILKDQIDCMGCLSACKFSNWSQGETGTTGHKADPRSFCIQKTLQSISHGGDVNKELMFAGHGAYRFSEDPFYKNGFIPTTKQLIDRLITGD